MYGSEPADNPETPPTARSRKPVAAVVAVAALGGSVCIWLGLCLVESSHVRTRRAQVDRQLDSMAQVARAQHDSMMTVPFSSLPPVDKACEGKLTDLGTNSILFVVHRERIGALAALGAEPAPTGSDVLVAIDPVGKLRSRSAQQTWDGNESYVGATMKTPPWRWSELPARLVEWGAVADAAKRVAVVLMREGKPPRMVTEMVFEGGTAGLHVRVVERDGRLLCEGRSDAAISRVQGPAIFGSATVDVAFDNAIEATPVVDLCRFDGGEPACAAARYQRSLF